MLPNATHSSDEDKCHPNATADATFESLLRQGLQVNNGISGVSGIFNPALSTTSSLGLKAGDSVLILMGKFKGQVGQIKTDILDGTYLVILSSDYEGYWKPEYLEKDCVP